MAAVEGPVAEFSGFANFEEKRRRWNLLIPKIVNEMGSFGQIRKNSLSRFCRPILDIFGFALLRPPSCLSRRDNGLKFNKTNQQTCASIWL